MQDSLNNINSDYNISLSRNRPVALIVKAASFLGSHLAERLLEKNIQVVAIDQLSSSNKFFLENANKDKNFHFINHLGTEAIHLKLARIDYLFFVANEGIPHLTELLNTLELLYRYQKNNETSPRFVLISSIELYKRNLGKFADLKHLEISLAKYAKEHRLNARIIRLGSVFGERMNLKSDDSLVSLIRQALTNNLSDGGSLDEFSTRALYIDDAVDLILKTAFLNGTANKIYDGVNPDPIKLEEIKKVLNDPIWYENYGLKFTSLPIWSTPNLSKTIKELSWKPKTSWINALKKTLKYFQISKEFIDREDIIPKKGEASSENLAMQTPSSEVRKLLNELKISHEEFKKKHGLPFSGEEGKEKKKLKVILPSKGKFLAFLGLAIILFGLLYPLITLTVGAFTIRQHLEIAQDAIALGQFEKASVETKAAMQAIKQSKEVINSFQILKRIGLLDGVFNYLEELFSLTEEGIEGVNHAVIGMEVLFKTTKIISGELNEDPQALYQKAQLELTSSGEKIAKVKLGLSDKNLLDSSPGQLKVRIEDLTKKLDSYLELVEKAKAAAYLLPEVTAVNGSKKYLILLQNNFELRPTGGFIGSFAKLEFEKGKIKKIAVDDIYNLDGELKEIIEPPIDLKNDLGQNRLFLRDSNFEPDFPTSARQAEFLYKKITGEQLQGVIALDLMASSKLVEAVGGLALSDYKETITSKNLFEKAISHAEVNFFPGSQAKKNFLTSLTSELFNKIFFLDDQNWPAIVKAVGESLEEKHLLVYLTNQEAFSYLTSQNWAGVLPRQPNIIDGQTDDFLAVIDANLGANKSNYYLERSFKLNSLIGKEGQIFHTLVINYKNNSPSDVFPAGKYKNRLRVYLPSGTKLDKATLGSLDITSKVLPFSDYGRTGFSTLIEVLPRKQQILTLNYSLQNPLAFKGKENRYRLDVLKQPGTSGDPILTYPINMQANLSGGSDSFPIQEISVKTDLKFDRTIEIKFTLK
ncbi:DUF4012 domain-containing protein [Candidatus Daviesbacteria bacterium]|nr:DUF4012 domain-containing protein [Candidatus Daviesbacteria bacterium]